MSDFDGLNEHAYHGLAGRIVRMVEPHSEADPAALLVQALVAFGSVIGRSAHFQVEARDHYANLFAGFVGETSKARKGSSWAHVERLFGAVDSVWADTRVEKGLSSGEGLIWAVRDPKVELVEDAEQTVEEGVADKRLLVVEEELASVLKMMTREGNILSTVIRSAWDTGKLRTLTKTTPARATGAHISLIGHITADELRRHLGVTEMANGFANRFLWVRVRRSKFLPEGGRMHTADVTPLVRQIAEAVDFARGRGDVDFDPGARALWHDVYEQLSTGAEGMLGALTGRAEAQTRRLAMLYALLDCSPTVQVPHLLAALALWDYCFRSTELIFGDSLGDPTADEILRALRGRDVGLTKTEISDLFGRHKRASETNRALGVLLDRGLADYEVELTDGRSVERWFATAKEANYAKEAPSNPLERALNSLPSLISHTQENNGARPPSADLIRDTTREEGEQEGKQEQQQDLEPGWLARSLDEQSELHRRHERGEL